MASRYEDATGRIATYLFGGKEWHYGDCDCAECVEAIA